MSPIALWGQAQTLLTVAGVLLGILAGAMRWALGTIRNYGISPPRVWLGDLLKDRGGGDPAYLLHVTASGLVVREWDSGEERWHEPRDVRFAEAESRRYRPVAFGCCGECSMINPQCEGALPAAVAVGRGGWFCRRGAGVFRQRLVHPRACGAAGSRRNRLRVRGGGAAVLEVGSRWNPTRQMGAAAYGEGPGLLATRTTGSGGIRVARPVLSSSAAPRRCCAGQAPSI
jgi:hypothetical protein